MHAFNEIPSSDTIKVLSFAADKALLHEWWISNCYIAKVSHMKDSRQKKRPISCVEILKFIKTGCLVHQTLSYWFSTQNCHIKMEVKSSMENGSAHEH